MATKNIKSFLTPKLRKAALAWYARNDVLKRIRVERGLYQCEQCKLIFKKDKIHVDHIEPVVDIKTGFVDWNTYIERLLVGPEGLQGICVNCHDTKTTQEDMMREYYRIEKQKSKSIVFKRTIPFFRLFI